MGVIISCIILCEDASASAPSSHKAWPAGFGRAYPFRQAAGFCKRFTNYLIRKPEYILYLIFDVNWQLIWLIGFDIIMLISFWSLDWRDCSFYFVNVCPIKSCASTTHIAERFRNFLTSVPIKSTYVCHVKLYTYMPDSFCTINIFIIVFNPFLPTAFFFSSVRHLFRSKSYEH